MPEQLPPDPYKALGIAKDATTDAVKKAFRKLALTSHPDKTKALPEKERKVKEEQFHSYRNAHDLLVDEDERKRYDLRVERDALMARRPTYGPSSSATQAKPPSARPQPHKSTTTPIFSTKPAPVYETREPKQSYEDDYTRPRYETRRPANAAPSPTKRYEEDHYDVSSSSARRSTGRAEQDRRDREARLDDERLRRKQEEARLKAEEKRLWEARQRQRDRERTRNTHSKRQVMVETDSEDSEIEQFMKPPPRRSPERKPKHEDKRHDDRDRRYEKYDKYDRYDDSRRSRRTEDKGRKSRSEESDDSEDDRHYSRSYARHEEDRIAAAAKHMISSGGKAIVEKLSSHDKRPVMTRSRATASGSKKASPPPPTAPPAPPVESSKRPSARRAESSRVESSKSKGSSKKTIDIVDAPPSPKYDYDSYEDRRDTKKSSSSRMPASSRAATFNDKTSEKVPNPGIRRTQTAPISKGFSSSAGHTPMKSSRLQHQISEESSSSESEDEPPPPRKPTTTSYRYDTGKARVVDVSPERLASARDSSRSRPTYERTTSSAARSSSQRGPPQRAQTFEEPHSRRAAHSANNSSDKPALFGEVKYSPKIMPDNIRYADYAPRRGSADDARYDRKASEAEHYMKSTRGVHPGMGGRQASWAQDIRA